jgi:hypothetical protein
MEDFLEGAFRLLEELPAIYEEDCEAALLHSQLLLRDTAIILDETGASEDSPWRRAASSGLEEFYLEMRCVVAALSDLLDSESRQIYAINAHRGRGRPKVYINKDQLQFLLESNFKLKDIASMFLVSQRTIKRRIQLYGLEDIFAYSNISDSELDNLGANFIYHPPKKI